MPITDADILYKLATTAGTAGDSQPGTPAGSLGKYISTTELDDDTLVGNLFDVITGDENASGDVEYRCMFVQNAHATLTLLGARVWLTGQTPGGADVAISVDTTAASDVDATAAQAKQVADENTEPTGQTFTAPTTKAAGLVLGDLAPGQVRAVWFRRTATDSGAMALDDVQWRVEGDTDE